MMLELLDGVVTAHAVGFVHGEILPETIAATSSASCSGSWVGTDAASAEFDRLRARDLEATATLLVAADAPPGVRPAVQALALQAMRGDLRPGDVGKLLADALAGAWRVRETPPPPARRSGRCGGGKGSVRAEQQVVEVDFVALGLEAEEGLGLAAGPGRRDAHSAGRQVLEGEAAFGVGRRRPRRAEVVRARDDLRRGHRGPARAVQGPDDRRGRAQSQRERPRLVRHRPPLFVGRPVARREDVERVQPPRERREGRDPVPARRQHQHWRVTILAAADRVVGRQAIEALLRRPHERALERFPVRIEDAHRHRRGALLQGHQDFGGGLAFTDRDRAAGVVGGGEDVHEELLRQVLDAEFAVLAGGPEDPGRRGIAALRVPDDRAADRSAALVGGPHDDGLPCRPLERPGRGLGRHLQSRRVAVVLERRRARRSRRAEPLPPRRSRPTRAEPAPRAPSPPTTALRRRRHSCRRPSRRVSRWPRLPFDRRQSPRRAGEAACAEGVRGLRAPPNCRTRRSRR